MTSAASNKRTSNKTRRRNAAIAFLSNISLDGSYSGGGTASDVQPLSHFKNEVAGDEDDDEDGSMGVENEPPAPVAAAPVERGAVPGAAEQAAVCDAAATDATCRTEPDAVSTLSRSVFRERSLLFYSFYLLIYTASECV